MMGGPAGGPGGDGGVEDVIDGGCGFGWAEVVVEDDPGSGQQSASADRTGPGAFALRQRAAGEGGEADLRMDLHHRDVGVADPRVDLEQFVSEGERLRGHTGAGRGLVHRGSGGVVCSF
jgi:hypothetical protein